MLSHHLADERVRTQWGIGTWCINELKEDREDEADKYTSDCIVKDLFFHSSNFSLMVFR